MDAKRMTEEQYIQKEIDVFNRFPSPLEAKAKYCESVIFHKVINMLVRDADPYQIIIDLIKINEDIVTEIDKRLLIQPMPKFYIPIEKP